MMIFLLFWIITILIQDRSILTNHLTNIFFCHFPGGEKEKQIKEFARKFKLNKALMPFSFRYALKRIIKGVKK
jgi:hypothetical protein